MRLGPQSTPEAGKKLRAEPSDHVRERAAIVVREAPGAVSVPTEGGGGRSKPTVEAEPVVPSLTRCTSL